MCFTMILIRGVCVSKWSLSVCVSKWSLSGVSKWSGSPGLARFTPHFWMFDYWHYFSNWIIQKFKRNMCSLLLAVKFHFKFTVITVIFWYINLVFTRMRGWLWDNCWCRNSIRTFPTCQVRVSAPCPHLRLLSAFSCQLWPGIQWTWAGRSLYSELRMQWRAPGPELHPKLLRECQRKGQIECQKDCQIECQNIC